MKKTVLVLSIFIMFACSATTGRSITGSTGYVVMPTAEGIQPRQYNLGLNVFSETQEQKAYWKYYGGLGLEGAEISFMGRSEREGLFLNTKWFGALNNYDDPLLVGIGFENLSSLGTFGDYPNVFMVVTKKFLNGSSFSVGSTGRYLNKQVIASMMFGTEIFTSDSLSWLVDFVSYEDNKYNGNIGLRIYTTNNMYFNISAINALRNNTDPLLHQSMATISLTINGFM